MTSLNEKSQVPKKYRVLAKRCVYGAVGDVVDLSLTPGEELSMTEAGLLEPARPTVAAKKAKE